MSIYLMCIYFNTCVNCQRALCMNLSVNRKQVELRVLHVVGFSQFHSKFNYNTSQTFTKIQLCYYVSVPIIK